MASSDATDDKLTRVVTRQGDDGYTQLGKERVLKSAARIEAYGTVDEANSTIGVLRTAVRDDDRLNEWLRAIQHDLFDIGADLSMPGEIGALMRVKADPAERLEAIFAELNKAQPKLANFILPTGVGMAGAYAHLARTIIRRAERRVVALAQIEGQEVNPEIQRYLNRLSDLMFVIARHLNGNGQGDEIWAPRGQR